MATMASMTILNAKCLGMKSPPNNSSKAVTLRTLSTLKPSKISNPSVATAIAGTVFATLSSTDAAFAAQQIADIADGDNRGLALLLPIIPAIAWVLFNILQPALNQLNKMRNEKGFVVGLGLGGSLAAAGFASPSSASASELALIADAASSTSDNRGLLLLVVVAPALGWVLFNILQPALNQLNKMRSG